MLQQVGFVHVVDPRFPARIISAGGWSLKAAQRFDPGKNVREARDGNR
jgi:hypothetical protein